jgi:hypothetical protein
MLPRARVLAIAGALVQVVWCLLRTQVVIIFFFIVVENMKLLGNTLMLNPKSGMIFIKTTPTGTVYYRTLISMSLLQSMQDQVGEYNYTWRERKMVFKMCLLEHACAPYSSRRLERPLLASLNNVAGEATSL